MLSLASGRRLLWAAAFVIIFGLGGTPNASALERIRLLIPVRTIDEAYSPFVVAKEKKRLLRRGRL